MGDQDVGVGPSFVIETLLAVTDREVDRWRAEERARLVAPLMADIPVAFVTTALVPYALNLLQNVSAPADPAAEDGNTHTEMGSGLPAAGAS